MEHDENVYYNPEKMSYMINEIIDKVNKQSFWFIKSDFYMKMYERRPKTDFYSSVIPFKGFFK